MIDFEHVIMQPEHLCLAMNQKLSIIKLFLNTATTVYCHLGVNKSTTDFNLLLFVPKFYM